MDFEQALEVADEAVFIKTGKRLNNVEIIILEGSWHNKTYEDIAKGTNYSASYLKQTVGPKLWKLLAEALGEQVRKTNFRPALERKWRSTLNRANREGKVQSQFLGEKQSPESVKKVVQQSNFSTPHLSSKLSEEDYTPQENPQQDWGQAANVLRCYGRLEELALLERWILDEHCRLLALLGIGGIGKSTLAVKLAQQIQLEVRIQVEGY